MITLEGNVEAGALVPDRPVMFIRDNDNCVLLISRIICAYEAVMSVYCDETGADAEYESHFDGIEGDYDRFVTRFSGDPGLYYVTFRINTADGVYFVHSTGDELHGQLRENAGVCGRFQLLFTEEYGIPDPDFKNAAMYQIFIDRYRRSGKFIIREDAKYVEDWDNGVPEYTEYPGMEMDNNTFFGGDLYGIAAELEHIKSLGFNVIYLSPVFEAFSNHRYDVGDYMKVDGCIGGDEAFVYLCQRAHGLGMKVIIDGVFNHTGDKSVYFDKPGKYGNGAYSDPASPYRSWYNFRTWPDDYECWWGVKSLPRLNQDEPAVHDLICGQNGVIRRYLRMGADGYRLDVADELSEHMLDGIRAAANDEKPGSLIIGEVWEDASNKISYGKRRHYFSHAQLDSVMDYPLRQAVIEYVKTGSTDTLTSVLSVIKHHYPGSVRPYLMNFLGSHDTERIMTVLGGEDGSGLPGSALVNKRMDGASYELACKRLILAFSVLCFLPGIVSVYYGDEAGMQGYRDPFNRMPYPWGREDKNIMSRISSLLHQRKEFSGEPGVRYAADGILIITRGSHTLICNANDSTAEIFTGYDTDTVTVPPLGHTILKTEKGQKND